MKFLFIHPRFSGQFSALVSHLARDKRHQVVFITGQKEGSLPHVHKYVYQVPENAGTDVDPYLQALGRGVAHARATFNLAMQLKAKGFYPDFIYGYDGWGAPMFIREVFPDVPYLCYFEWFERAYGGLYNFDPASPLTKEHECVVRCYNSVSLINLYSCDHGISPTHWQRQQFPFEFRKKISVIYDGVDTNFYRPQPDTCFSLPRLGIDLSQIKQLVTYATRGMEPSRGFPQFIKAASLIQEKFPGCHIVVAGLDGVFYSKTLADGKTYKDKLLSEMPLDMGRLHFTGWLSRIEYRQLLQASSAHIYLTKPYVLSWSLIEALAMGCLVVASGTPPVTEIIEDGVHGLLVDFFSPEEIAEKVGKALIEHEQMASIRQAARAHIEEKYALKVALPRQLKLIYDMTAVTSN
jgi:glycosyltransferase involved in cell wall biosynthesis